MTLAYILLAASIVSFTGVKSSSNGIPLVETCNIPSVANPTRYKAYEQTVYGTIAGHDEDLDLYVPIRTKPVPLVVLIHGGGFIQKNKTVLDGEARQLVSLGYAAASIDYPLAPTKTTPGNYFSTQIQAVRCAIRYLRANAVKYGIDPGKVAVRGQSAGANLSAFVSVLNNAIGPYDSPTCASNSLASTALLGGIHQYGIYDFTIPGVEYFFKNYTGQTAAGNPNLAKATSPYYMFQTNILSPQLLIHGLQDTVVSPAQSIALNTQFVKLGIKSAFVVLPTRGHGGPLFSALPDYREQACTAQAFLGLIFK